LSGNKREQEGNDKEKVCKMVKLSDPGQRYEKENVDPRRLTATVIFENLRSIHYTSLFILDIIQKKRFSSCLLTNNCTR
jgi:hypothetical protein